MLNISKEKLQSFFNLLFNFQVKRDSYLKETLNNSNVSEKINNDVNSETRNNSDGTQTVINNYSNNSREEITRKDNQILEKICYDQNDKIIEIIEYKYINNKVFEKIYYDGNNKITGKSNFLYFKTEDEAQMYCKKFENNLPENIDGWDICKDNEEYIVEIMYSSDN